MIPGIPDDRWREAGALFHELVELDESTRSERLARVGDSDPELRAAVEALLAADAIAVRALPEPGFGLGALTDAEATDTLALEGQTIGRFRVLEQIAWGGMGVVYRAEDVQLHRSVALKFPLLDRGLTDAARATTVREARSAGALDHPNLCPIFDIGESDAGPFFVMPLYRGETLKDRITRAAPLEISESLAILEQLAAGLACAHGAGIIHCDIKPGNVMLLPDGTVKLLDFGLARAVAADSSVPSRLVGTIAYMSPEQLRNEPADARADLWALGVILYEMLCGARPFVGDGARKIANAVLESEPRALSSRGVVVPAKVQDLLNTLLAKDPRARVQTAAELSGVIAGARGGLERSASPRITVRRIAAAGALLAAIGLATIWLWLRPPTTLISSKKLSPGDTLVLADFEVSGRGLDSTIVPALNSILRRDFEDSKAVMLVPAAGIRTALQRMRRPPATRITPELAREIAQREGMRAVVSGSVSPLASSYLITLRLVESETGNELASSSATAVSAERELLPALATASQALRRAIGEARPNAGSAPLRTRKLLTTSSLEAARVMWAGPKPTSDPEKIAVARAAVRRDPAFAYAWMSIGTMLSWTRYRSAALDSAFTMAYRLRDSLTLMEQAQVSGLYWWNVQRDRRSAFAEMETALGLDTTMLGAVALNMTEVLNESRQFERNETFARRIENWKTVGAAANGALVRSQVAQGKYAAAESTIVRRRSLLGASDIGSVALERFIPLSELRFDSVETVVAQMRYADDQWALLYRLRGRLAEAHRMEDRLDSARASSAAAAGARFDPTSGRALTLAREALWLDHDSTAAIAQLDRRWETAAQIHDIQDRIDGIQAAALYAAGGRPAKSRTLLLTFERGADTIAKRAIYEYRQAARAEIALAEGRFTEAMRLYRASDLAADGLPASTCAVCVLPHLARVAERAGWSDSALVFWNAYVSRPAIDRLSTDQWYLASAYSKLAALATSRGESERAAGYRRALDELHAPTPSHSRMKLPVDSRR